MHPRGVRVISRIAHTHQEHAALVYGNVKGPLERDGGVPIDPRGAEAQLLRSQHDVRGNDTHVLLSRMEAALDRVLPVLVLVVGKRQHARGAVAALGKLVELGEVLLALTYTRTG